MTGPAGRTEEVLGVATKTALRQVCRGARDRLTLVEREAAARAIAEHFPIEVAKGRIVAGYAGIGSELSVWSLLEKLAEADVACALPVTMATRQPLIFRRWAPGDELEAGEFKIPTPRPEQPEVQPGLLLVPLLGFDRWGHRLGYGGGYYDRTLAALAQTGQKPVAVGVAFAVQEVPRVAAEPTDIALDAVLTERGLLPMPGGAV